MTRQELINQATELNLTVPAAATKADIKALIEAAIQPAQEEPATPAAPASQPAQEEPKAEATTAEAPKTGRAKFDFGGKLAEVTQLMADSFGAEAVSAHDRHSSITIKAGKVSVTCYVKKRGLTVGCKDEVKANLLAAMPTEDVGYFEKYSNKWEITYDYGQLGDVISNLKTAMTAPKPEKQVEPENKEADKKEEA